MHSVNVMADSTKVETSASKTQGDHPKQQQKEPQPLATETSHCLEDTVKLLPENRQTTKPQSGSKSHHSHRRSDHYQQQHRTRYRGDQPYHRHRHDDTNYQSEHRKPQHRLQNETPHEFKGQTNNKSLEMHKATATDDHFIREGVSMRSEDEPQHNRRGRHEKVHKDKKSEAQSAGTFRGGDVKVKGRGSHDQTKGPADQSDGSLLSATQNVREDRLKRDKEPVKVTESSMETIEATDKERKIKETISVAAGGGDKKSSKQGRKKDYRYRQDRRPAPEREKERKRPPQSSSSDVHVHVPVTDHNPQSLDSDKTQTHPYDSTKPPDKPQDRQVPIHHKKKGQPSHTHGGGAHFSKPRGKRVAPTVQSDELAQHLTAETYECMVCCDRVRGRDQVWNCQSCFHVFHLRCIRKWATAPAAVNTDEVSESEGWRCPSCRNLSSIIPTVYKCYCGKLTNPRLRSRGELTVPHSCGDICLKKLAVTPESKCRHKCRLPCHPGPCPPCPVMVTRKCPCGRKSFQVRCSKVGDLPSCGSVCHKDLNCGRHVCESVCHPGPCATCPTTLSLVCHCKRVTREVCCGETQELEFSCAQICSKELDCGNHLCELPCHKGVCPSCQLLPSNVITCPCGATPISDLLLSEGLERVSCLDPVPTCKNICGKRLPCSTQDTPHTCSSPCHIGECPPCDKSTIIWCRCGQTSVQSPCVDIMGREQFLCQHLCNKKKKCGRHRCNVRCCVDTTHECTLLCGKKLQCGLHTCQENCHSGHCQRCWETSFEELSCHCGAEVIYPPIPCGTRPPACSRVCARIHSCVHPVTHPCHNEEECPPCHYLTEKMCMGEHEVRSNIPCHIADVSCGNQCGKLLPCDMHKCLKTCHKGECLGSSLEGCRQPCTTKRTYCEHACGSPCHVGRPCPDNPCRSTITVECKCGRRSEKILCLACGSDVMKQSFQKMLSKDIGVHIREGQSVSISTLSASNSLSERRTLECDEVCAQEERNKKLAAALEIEHPNISVTDTSAQYSLFLLEQARGDLSFVSSVEEDLRTLVESALKSTSVQSRSHSFRPMKSTQRRFIHELAMHYGCETISYDPEPNRTVMVSTKKSTAKLPALSLTKLTERERYRPPPAPVHVMAVSDSNEGKDSHSSVPDYFADDFSP